MQVKKDEVRLRILREAEMEFLEKGFLNASLRKIVKAAGTSLGNFYNYFENKEQLFDELVREEYNSFIFFIEHHDKIERPDYLWEITDVEQWRKVLSKLIQQIMPGLTDRFVLLIESSKGTSFENTRQNIIDLLKEHFVEHMERYGSEYIDVQFADIIAEQLLNGMILIIKKYRDEKVRKRLLTEHILFYFIGSIGLLGDWK